MEFKTFNLDPNIEAGAAAAGFVTPTPIQIKAIPPVMKGRDIIGLAQTGTGKTAAFALPILHRLMQGKRGHVRSLIIAPTRELAEQINDAINSLGKKTRMKSVTVYGGVNINPQIQKLNRGAEIVVACPGRLLDHMQRGTIDLTRVESSDDRHFSYFNFSRRNLTCILQFQKTLKGYQTRVISKR